MASRQFDRFTIRLSDPSEFKALHVGESVNVADEKNDDDAKTDDNGGNSSPSRRRSSARQANSTTKAPTTRRRKRQAALRLAESSPAFVEMEKLANNSNNNDVNQMLSVASNSVTRFALVGAIQPNDVLESITSLSKMKAYKCASAKTNVSKILSSHENYPLNLVFVRMPLEQAAVIVDTTTTTPFSVKRRKRIKSKKKKPVIKEPTCISLLSSDEEEDGGDGGADAHDEETSKEIANGNEKSPIADESAIRKDEGEPFVEPGDAIMEEAKEHVVVSADVADGKSSTQFDARHIVITARPDPQPGYRPDEWVLTPFGPGIVDSFRIDRFPDMLDSLVHPILSYLVTLPFGAQLYVTSKQLMPFEGSPYANETIVSTPKLSLCRGDVVRLQPGIYLNDQLVNFFLQQLPPSNKVYVFSSYLYTRIADLSLGVKKNSSEHYDLLWNNLKGWMKNVHIFDYDVLLFPIHEKLHWSVVAVCHAGLLLQHSTENEDEEERIPCILHLDSGKRFRLHKSSSLFTRIRTFLQACVDKQTNVEVEVTATTLKGGSPPVPAQENETDCGVYMLEWIERIVGGEGLCITQEFVDAKGNVPPFGKNAFEQSLIDRKRHEFQSLIYTLLNENETKS